MKYLKTTFFGLIFAVISSISLHAQSVDVQELTRSLSHSVGRVLVLEEGSGGTGTGFVIGKNRNGNFLMLTNFHVSENYETRVGFLNPEGLTANSQDSFSDLGTYYQARVVNKSKGLDIALLELYKRLPEGADVEIRALPIVDYPFAQGKQVVAIGYPGITDHTDVAPDAVGFYQPTISSGIVKKITTTADWGYQDTPPNPIGILQHSAEINPGNSGGPLTDLCGAVLGMNTQVISDGVGSPINSASSNVVLMDFLRSAGIEFTTATNPCDTPLQAPTKTSGGFVIDSNKWLIAGLIGLLLLIVGVVVFIFVSSNKDDDHSNINQRAIAPKPSHGAARPSQKSETIMRVSVKVEGKPESITSISHRDILAGVAVGRSADSLVRIDDPKVSRKHFMLKLRERKLYIKDTDSNNGVKVDNVKLEANVWTPLSSRAIIKIGSTEIRAKRV